MDTFVLAQVFVCISCLIYSTSLLFKAKSTLLFLQIISAIFFVTQYFLLGAYIGAIVAILETLRSITFYFIDKKFNKKKVRIIASYIFVVIGFISAIFTWEAWFSILPLLGLTAVSVCLGFENVLYLKLSCTFSAFCAIIYMLFLNSIFGAATQIFIVIVGLIGVALYVKKNKNKQQNNEVETSLKE